MHTNHWKTPNELVPKLFGPIRERYLSRPGGYTRILRLEPVKEDQAESAILELVDGPKDMRFAMTAKTLSRLPENKQPNEITAKNVKKVTQFRKAGVEQLRHMVARMRGEHEEGWDNRTLLGPKRVYLLEEKVKRDMHYPEEVDDWQLPNSYKVELGVEAPARTYKWDLGKVLKQKRAEKEKQLEAERAQQLEAERKEREARGGGAQKLIE